MKWSFECDLKKCGRETCGYLGEGPSGRGHDKSKVLRRCTPDIQGQQGDWGSRAGWATGIAIEDVLRETPGTLQVSMRILSFVEWQGDSVRIWCLEVREGGTGRKHKGLGSIGISTTPRFLAFKTLFLRQLSQCFAILNHFPLPGGHGMTRRHCMPALNKLKWPPAGLSQLQQPGICLRSNCNRWEEGHGSISFHLIPSTEAATLKGVSRRMSLTTDSRQRLTGPLMASQVPMQDAEDQSHLLHWEGVRKGPVLSSPQESSQGILQAAHGAGCPPGGAPTFTCWVSDLRLVGKHLLPQGLVVCSRQAESLGGGRRRSKDGSGLSLILLVPALSSSRNVFSLGHLRNPTVIQGSGWKRKRCPAQCWSHWTSYHLPHHLSPQPCVTVWAVSMSVPILACYCLHVCTRTLMRVGVICRLCCVNVWVQESECLFKNTFWRFLLHTCYGLACVPPKYLWWSPNLQCD